MVSLSHNSDSGQEGVVGKYAPGLVLGIVVEEDMVVDLDSDSGIVVVIEIGEEGYYQMIALVDTHYVDLVKSVMAWNEGLGI